MLDNLSYFEKVSATQYRLKRPFALLDKAFIFSFSCLLFLLAPFLLKTSGNECGGEIECLEVNSRIECHAVQYRAPVFGNKPYKEFKSVFQLNDLNFIDVKEVWAKHTGLYYQLQLKNSQKDWIVCISTMSSLTELQLFGSALADYKANPQGSFYHFYIEPYTRDYFCLFASILFFILPLFLAFNRILTTFDISNHTVRVIRKIGGIHYSDYSVHLNDVEKFYTIPKATLMLKKKMVNRFGFLQG